MSQSSSVADTKAAVAVAAGRLAVVVAVVAIGAFVAVYSTPLAEPPGAGLGGPLVADASIPAAGACTVVASPPAVPAVGTD